MKVTYGTKNVVKNSARSFVYRIISMGVLLFSAPLLLWCLGEEKYGVWQTLLSTISWIYYLDLGIGSGLRLGLSKSLAENKFEDAKKQVSISYLIVSGISLGVLVLVVILIQFLNLESVFNIDVNTGENINSIFLISYLFVSINFVLSLINNIYYSLQRASMVGALGLFGQILNVIGVYVYYKTGNGLIMVVALIEGVTQAIKNIVGSIIAFHKYPECKPSLKYVDFSFSKSILSFGIMAFLGNILALILNSTDNIIILRYFGAAEVTPYSFCFKYFGVISGIFAVIVVPLQSAYTMAFTNKDFLWIKKNLLRALGILIIFIIGSIVAALLIKPITCIWLKRNLAYSDGAIFWMLIYTCILMISHVQSTFLIGIGRIKEITVASGFQAIINIPLSIILARNCGMGVAGVALGSVISLAIGVVVALIIMIDSIKKMNRE